ncbi:MAG: FtsQ-type POTRA domain-containing protein [Alphaproteobacteria bacterium]|nr:FtsQ-type POTRA domain-containing protein [Alphaproteobacteria bacterium]
MGKKRKNYRKSFIIKLSCYVLLLAISCYATYSFYPKFNERLHSRCVEEEFILKRININELVNVNSEKLFESINVDKGMLLLDIDIREIQNIILKDSWVEKANVYIQYPDALFINIFEKEPKAISNKNNDFVIVDQKGDVLSEKILKKYENLPVIISEENNISEIIKYMETQPYLYDDWIRAEYIGNRRWDVFLVNDLKIMLPEKDVIFALEKLNDLRVQEGLFKYDISLIDLRFEDKAIIK